MLGARQHGFFSRAEAVPCASRCTGATHPLYSMTGWEGAGTAELPWEEAGCELQGLAALRPRADARLPAGAPAAQNGFNLHHGPA